jgi:hypothetical protein
MPTVRARPTISAVPKTMQSRVLEVAAEIAGGVTQLCERLKVTEPELRRWLADEETCPLPAYLEAVDILLESERGFSAIFSSQSPENGPHER